MHRAIFSATVGGLIASMAVVLAQIQTPANHSRIDVVVAVDNSGSMASSDPRFLLRAAVSRFAADLRPADRCSLVIFGDGSRLALPLKARTDADFGQTLDASLKELNYREQYTDIPGGFAAALYELREHGRQPGQHAIILLTDGFVDLRDRAQIAGRKQWLQQDLRREAEGAVRVFGIAFTATADLQLLQSLATATQGDYRKVDKAVNLEKALTEIREEMLRPPKRPPPAQEPLIPPAKQSQSGPSSNTAIWMSLAAVLGALSAVALVAIVAYRMLLRRNQAAETIPKDARGFLRPCTGDGQVIEIARIRTLIGRKDSSDVALNEPTISQPQASIEFRDGCFYLRDMRSRNGTFVHRVDRKDAHRVDPMEGEPLKHGDIIRFGKVRSFIFETVEGGGTTISAGTNVLPAACHYHSARPPQDFCRACHRALCAECAGSHPCPAHAGAGPATN
jgi:Mg-chelatase subunit ChlD